MPIREYECPACGFRTERLEFTADPNPLDCIRCRDEHGSHVEMERVVSAVSLAFKGEGWTRPSTYQKPKRLSKGA